MIVRATSPPAFLDIERICSDLGLQFELEMELLILKIWFKVLPCDFAIERSHLDLSIRWSANSELQRFAPFGGALRLHSVRPRSLQIHCNTLVLTTQVAAQIFPRTSLG
ncbi:hypothetical protein AcV5_008290 [Taiwanofungus camphoratus]|nr:hypothetical protein AcV5_008290 [Antrodia cinnamomea]